MNTKAKGYILGIIAAATYGMNPLFALPLYAHGLDADSVLFFRYLFAIPMLGAMLRLRGRNFSVGRRNILPLFAMGMLFALSSLTLFGSYNYMDSGIASTLLFVYPVMVAAIMAMCFGQRLTLRDTLCLAGTIVGILLLYKGNGTASLSLTGTALVMVSSLSYAVYIVAVNRSRLQHLPTLQLTFYVTLFGWMLFAVRAILHHGVCLPPEGHAYLWLFMFALGLLPTAVSLLCTTAAIHCIGSTPTAILGALEPVTAIVFGVTVFGEVLTLRDVAGIVLIIAAVTLVICGAKGFPSILVRLRKMFPSLRHHKSF